MKVSTQAWNRFVTHVMRHRLVGVRSVRAEPWRHPWYTRVGWDLERKAFVWRTKPGFCLSGYDQGAREVTVTARVAAKHAPPKTLERLRKSRHGGSGEDLVDAYLREGPAVTIGAATWRAVGTDAVAFGDGAAEVVPRYFRKRGVNPAVRRGSDAFGLTATAGATADGFPIWERPRLLRACDLVLYHDRPANSTDWQLGTGVEGTIAQFRAVTTSRPDRQARPYLRTVRRYEPPAPLDPVAFLQGGAEDGGTDSIVIATLYLLSEAGTREGSAPETNPARWSPHVEHRVFWNLQYVLNGFVSGPAVLPLEVPGLELAAGSLLSVAPLAAAANDAYEQALAFVQTRLLEGRFFSH